MLTVLLLFCVFSIVLCQPLPSSGYDGATVVGNADNFRKMYNIAQQMMELGGTFLQNQPGSGSNSVLGEEVRPRFRGVRNFESDNSITSGGSSDGSIANMAKIFGEYFQPPPPPTTTTTTQRPRPSGMQALFNTFLGSSVDDGSDSLPPPPPPRPRQPANLFNLFGMPGGGNSVITSTISPASQNIFASFLGGLAPTTTTTTQTPPLQGWMKMFGVPTARSERETQPDGEKLGQINLWELFGVTQRTTTTTQAPLQALLDPNAKFNGGAQNIDAIMNALMRSNAKRAPAEPAGPAALISQFFGGK